MRKLLSLRAISATLLFSVVIFALVVCQNTMLIVIKIVMEIVLEWPF